MDQDTRDADFVLVDLERGLRSDNVCDQSEAVVRFNGLFQRCPMPILIDSACLKLSEAFRYCSNFIRIQICEVFHRNQTHLSKIYNVEVFYRNIFTVTTSNDPIARSITLLTLGNIAGLLKDHRSIHHCISSSLESTIECELNAAIICAAAYVKRSSEFARNIYPRIVRIIDSSKSSTEMKLRSLSVLDHGFYNVSDAMTVRNFLIANTEESLTTACLTLTTKIAYNSLSQIEVQIEHLLKSFSTAANHKSALRTNILNNLKFLAEKSPHIWKSEHVKPLIEHIAPSSSSNSTKKPDDSTLILILSVFCKLLICPCNFIAPEERQKIFDLCYELALNTTNIPVCSKALALMTVLYEDHTSLRSSSDSQDDVEMTEKQPVFEQASADILKAIKTYLTGSLSGPSSSSLTTKTSIKSARSKNVPHQPSEVQLVPGDHGSACPKAIYHNIVKLCHLNPQFCPEIIKLVHTKISSRDVNLLELTPAATELLCALIPTATERPSLSSDDCSKLIKSKSKEISAKNLLNLSILYFQTLSYNPNPKIAESFVDKITQGRDFWFCFKVLREAMRYGHYQAAGQICKNCHDFVTVDTLDFYLKALERMCAAEQTLKAGSEQLNTSITKAISLHESAASFLRASGNKSHTIAFQVQFLLLRTRQLHAHKTLPQICKTYQFSPISYYTLMAANGAIRGVNDPSLLKVSIIQRMQKLAKDFRFLADGYEALTNVSFDCDDRTLEYVNLLKHTCVIMADAIDAVFSCGKLLNTKLALGPKMSELSLEHRSLRATCDKLVERVRSEILSPGFTASSESIEPLVNTLKKCSEDVLKSNFVFPRYFFQSQQTTQIKLSITPNPHSSSQPLTGVLNTNLVLKVEGLVESSFKKQIRKMSKILISLTTSPAKPSDPPFSLLIQSSTKLLDNYFKTEFLLPLKCSGNFTVVIAVSLIDEHETHWKTGPEARFNLNVSS